MPFRLARRPTAGTLLGRLLEDPELLPQIRALPATVLRRAIVEIGLEDAGELIALASLEQLREVFDEDLWRSPQPGQDDDFDGPRFALWLEVLLEAGEGFVADRLADFSEDFLVFAFSQLVRVIDTAALTASLAAAEDAGQLDWILDSTLCQELDEYLVVSRLETGWDAVWTSLLALDGRHGTLLRAVLHRCWLATQEQVDRAGGLHAALNDDELLLEDARAEREERRAARGYVSPADARAFLALARRTAGSPESDPITRAYFRDLQRDEPALGSHGSRPQPARATPLRRLLAEAGIDPRPETSLPARLSLFRRSMAALLVSDPDAHRRVLDELAYLANVLVAGDTSRGWAPAEAAQRVLALCDEGLHSVLSREPHADERDSAERILARWGAVGLFRVAWAATGPAP